MTISAARRSARSVELRLGAALGLALTLSACGTASPLDGLERAAQGADRFAASFFGPPGPTTRPLSVAPPPAQKPRRPLSAPIAATDPRTGASVVLTPRHLGGGVVEVRQSDGCVWRRSDWFAPSIRWSGCGDSAAWRDGRSEVSGGAGLWPLRLGAEGRFERRAVSHTGRTHARGAVCRVSDAVEVLRKGRAPTPAFVVDCDDGRRVRTTWWAPGEGPVAFRSVHEEQGVEELWVAR